MAHELDQTTGRAAVFVTGQPAWHKLGTVIDSAANSAEAIKLAGLDWNIEQWPVRAFNPDTNEQAACPGRVANVRTDTKRTLGIVSTGYTIFQNHEAFDFMDSIVGDKLAMYETAGSLNEGRRVWMLARIPKEYRAGREDIVKPYVLLTNSHDGTQALRMIPTTIRVVCQNTLNLALNNSTFSEGLSIYHYASLADRVRDARNKFGIITARFDQFDEELQAMIGKQLSASQVQGYFDALLPDSKSDRPGGSSQRTKNYRSEILEAFQFNFTDARQSLPGIRGTAWAAYNAVSEWADHAKTVRGKTSHEQANNRLNSMWFGSSNRIKQNAYHGALELTKA